MDEAVASDDPLAVLFLDRLRRLTDLDRALDTASVEEHLRRLVHKAIFSIWLDCREQGVGAEAARVVHGRGRLTGPAATGVGGT